MHISHSALQVEAMVKKLAVLQTKLANKEKEAPRASTVHTGQNVIQFDDFFGRGANKNKKASSSAKKETSTSGGEGSKQANFEDESGANAEGSVDLEGPSPGEGGATKADSPQAEFAKGES